MTPDMAAETDDDDCQEGDKPFLEALKDCLGGEESGKAKRQR